MNLFEPWKKSGDSKEFIGSGFVVDDDDEGPLIATNAHVVPRRALFFREMSRNVHDGGKRERGKNEDEASFPSGGC